MQELIVTARNIRIFLSDEEGVKEPIRPEIEAVLTMLERKIEFVGAGLSNTEKTETVRFILSPDAARKFAASLNDWADEADEKADKLKDALEKLD